jgi:hypothetical protein
MKSVMIFAMILAFTGTTVFGDETTPPPTPGEEQPEVLTRGPVNEAFAQPVDLQNQEGLIAPSEPPSSIAENPPDERPSGNQFVWVPGYWAWDSDRNGYIWVSGCWRAAPPGMSWMPGYWAKVPGGWQWVAGFWSPVGTGEIEYLPAPPVIANVEPVIAAPSPDNIWVPPCWYWRNGGYVLRSGYWLVGNPDWVWTPSHYVWTPRGYLFVRGHWDYSLSRRGVLFAPVYFPRSVYVRPGFTFSLGVVVDTGAFQFSLFSRPSYCHYYFGDYYDDVYVSIGIFPRYECERRHIWYDPIYYHEKWKHHRDEPKWEEHERHEYDMRRADKDLRPPRTYHEMENRLARLPEAQRKEIRMAEPINTVVNEKKTAFKFERIKPDTMQKINTDATEVRKYRDERSKWESNKGRTPEFKDQKVQVKEQPQIKEQKMDNKETRPQEKEQKMENRNTRPPEREQKAENKDVRPPQQNEQKVQSPKEPERIKVPPSPVVEKHSVMNVFRKGPPSRPSDEQKADDKNIRDNSGNRDNKTNQDNKDNRDNRRDRRDRNN